MDAVLDSTVMCHILRKPKKSRKTGYLETCLDAPLKKHSIILVLDYGKGLQSEWEKTCNPDLIQSVLTKWIELGIEVKTVSPNTLPEPMRRKLRSIGFTDTVDNLILRLANSLGDCVIASIDPDFWDPREDKGGSIVGNENSPIAKLCREELNALVLSLVQFMQKYK